MSPPIAAVDDATRALRLGPPRKDFPMSACLEPTSPHRRTAHRCRLSAHAFWTAACGVVGLVVAMAAAARPAAAQAFATTVFQPVVAAPMFAQPVTAFRPVVAAPVMPASAYVANYTPAGNYAAVTAFSPPVVAAAPSVIGVRTAYAPAMPAAVSMAAPVATTAFYAPPAIMPTTAFYAPAVAAPVAAPIATIAYSMPAPVAAPVVAAPVTAYYAPLYRRGLFGAYRPVSPGYFLAY
jgi:hypothetical protein